MGVRGIYPTNKPSTVGKARRFPALLGPPCSRKKMSTFETDEHLRALTPSKAPLSLLREAHRSAREFALALSAPP